MTDPHDKADQEHDDDVNVRDRQVIRNQYTGELEIVTSFYDGSTSAAPAPTDDD